MEKAEGMVPETNKIEDVFISVPEAGEGSSSTAVPMNMQGESSPSEVGSSQKEKETLSCRSNRSSSSTSASSAPSNEIACLNWTSSRSQTNQLKEWTFRAVSVFEWILVVCSVAGLLVSFIFHLCKFHVLGSIPWKWCVLVLVIVCGRHFMGWMMMRVKDSLVKRIFKFFKGNAHYSYYIYGLGKSVGVFLWFVLILLTWYLLLDSISLLNIWNQRPTEIRNFIRSNLITLVIVGALWVVKTFLVNKLSSSFQVTRYFDWIRNSLINQYILEVFKGSRMTVQNLINELDRGKEDQGVISRLLKIDPKEVSAWTMEDIIDSIRSKKLSSITKELENLIDDEDFRAKLEYEDKVPELDTAADLIFSKMNPPNDSPPLNSNSGFAPNKKRINKDDLQRLCSSGEQDSKKFGAGEAVAVIQQINGQKLVLRHFHHTSKNQIEEVSRQALKMWLVHATVERRTLVQSINDMKCAIKELNELFSGIVLILLIVIWSLMIGLLTREGLVLILSQLFFLTFMFGNTAKSAFEGIIFVFVKHPFDIGDLCLINREKMVVERINLLTTVFRKNNKDKVLYSNSVLSTIPIRNFYSGNVHTRDSLEFTIKWPTVLDKKIIKSLRRRIKKHLRKDKSKKWFPDCDLVVKELEDEQRAKMVLYVTCCNVNGHRSGVTMISLRHELIIALNRILRDLKIEHYEIRPQETDRMKNTAKPRSTQKRNQQSNESKYEESKSELNEETETETETEEEENN